MSTSQSQRHALVIGASMAGLLTAKVLSKHFDRVTVIEKDRIHDYAESRKGQPHTKHLHGLLAGGLDILEEYFPGLTQELIAHDAIYDDMGKVIKWYQCGGICQQFESGLKGVVQSRPLLELLVRRRAGAVPNIKINDGCKAVGWELAKTGVRGVELINGVATRFMVADLVVDASGRNAVTRKWMKTSGLDLPQKEEVVVRVGYSTCTFERDEDGDVCLYMSLPDPPHNCRSGYLFPLEGGRWMLTVAGWHGDYPPGDMDELVRFTSNLPLTDIHGIISKVRSLSEIVTYRFRSSQRWRYEKLHDLPDGLLVLGDAIASFNPVYGQGMTSAAMQARALDRCFLRQWQGRKLRKRYFRHVARIVNSPWQLATGADFRFTETKGPKPLATDLINAYIARLQRAMHTDTTVYRAFLDVMNLLRTPTSLLHPRIMWRVLRDSV